MAAGLSRHRARQAGIQCSHGCVVICDDRVSYDGGLSLLMMDGLLLIPLIMAAFFYPVEALPARARCSLVSFLVYEGTVIWKRHHVPASEDRRYVYSRTPGPGAAAQRGVRCRRDRVAPPVRRPAAGFR